MIELNAKARWFDVVYVLRKNGISKGGCYARRIDDGCWDGWYVRFDDGVDLAAVKCAVWGTLIIGSDQVFIGVKYG